MINAAKIVKRNKIYRYEIYENLCWSMMTWSERSWSCCFFESFFFGKKWFFRAKTLLPLLNPWKLVQIWYWMEASRFFQLLNEQTAIVHARLLLLLMLRFQFFGEICIPKEKDSRSTFFDILNFFRDSLKKRKVNLFAGLSKAWFPQGPLANPNQVLPGGFARVNKRLRVWDLSVILKLCFHKLQGPTWIQIAENKHHFCCNLHLSKLPRKRLF